MKIPQSIKFLTVILSCLSSYVEAGTSNGLISTTYVNARDAQYGDDAVFFAAGAHSGKPACSIQGDEWSIPLTTAAGKSQYAMLLSAVARGKAVAVRGSGACTAWPDRETVVYMFIVE